MDEFMILQIYNVYESSREEYLEAMKKVRENALRLGVEDHRLYQDEVNKNQFMEVTQYDNWLQYERLRRAKPHGDMTEIFDKLDQWIDGGLKNIYTVTYNRVL